MTEKTKIVALLLLCIAATALIILSISEIIKPVDNAFKANYIQSESGFADGLYLDNTEIAAPDNKLVVYINVVDPIRIDTTMVVEFGKPVKINDYKILLSEKGLFYKEKHQADYKKKLIGYAYHYE